jgi:sugar lactone lactonase YvrE
MSRSLKALTSKACGQQLFLDREDCDGLALDSPGNVWITGFRSPGILRRLKPDGTPPADVPAPAGSTTQVRFGGDGRDYYINIVPSDGGDSLKEGKPLASKSCLYRERSDVAGVLIPPARFKLG